jgi:hypothetical protein
MLAMPPQRVPSAAPFVQASWRQSGSGPMPLTAKPAKLAAGVEPNAVSALTSQLQPADFPRGHIVFAQGEPGDLLYIIISGKVKIGNRSPNGQEARPTCLANCRSSTPARGLRASPPSPESVLSRWTATPTLLAILGQTPGRRSPELRDDPAIELRYRPIP